MTQFRKLLLSKARHPALFIFFPVVYYLRLTRSPCIENVILFEKWVEAILLLTLSHNLECKRGAYGFMFDG